MSTLPFTAAAYRPYRTLDQLALEGLQIYARKQIALGRHREHEMLTRKPLVIPTELPTDLGENAKNTAALWALLGTDDKDDRYVGHSGPVGIAHLMTWGMEAGRVADIKSFLPWALFNTRYHERARIFCEAMKHPETVEIIKPIAAGIFQEAVYPPSVKNETPSKTSSDFIPLVRAAAKHPELHEIVDEFLPAALERELAWAPQNFAFLALSRYQAAGDFSPVYKLATQMLAQYGPQLAELTNPSCIMLIKELQKSGDKTVQASARRFAGVVFDRPEHFNALDHTECMLIAVSDDGRVDMLSRDREARMAQECVTKGNIFPRGYASLAGGYAPALDLLGDLSDLPFRKISDPARSAAKAIRAYINVRPGLYAGMDESYRARYAAIQSPQGQRLG